MFILSNFLMATASVLDLVLGLYKLIIIVRAIVSWVNADPSNPIVRFLYNSTEPLLYQIRRRLPVVFGGIDFSPLLALAGIYFLDIFLVRSLPALAVSIRCPVRRAPPPLRLQIRLQPRAAHTRIAGAIGPAIKVQVHAPP